MAQVKWDSSLETGNELVDDQHRQVFAIVNELYDAIVNHADRETQDEILDRAMSHVQRHFVDEEALMRSIDYPRLAEQQRLHQGFSAQAGRMSDEYRSGKKRLPITLAFFLYDWLVKHIRNEDVRIAEFIRSNER